MTLKPKRSLFMVAGIDAIGYGAIAIRTLLGNCRDDIAFTVLTDSAGDKQRYAGLLAEIAPDRPTRVFDMADCDARAETVFAAYPNVGTLRQGHPCWRKVTDPSLFVEDGEEVIVLDPDLYFPAAFTFEATPPGQLLLMRQRRHCLLPPEVVYAAFGNAIPLAHHTDIGVAQHTSLPWDFVDDVIAKLGGARLPRIAHVESILWAAIAMKVGGGYLSPSKWACWERTLDKRVALLAGLSGPTVLRAERVTRLKCFHASSGAKDWMIAAEAAGILRQGGPQLEPSPIAPFVELTQAEYERGEAAKRSYHAVMRTLRLSDPLQGRTDKSASR